MFLPQSPLWQGDFCTQESASVRQVSARTIRAAVQNARALLALQAAGESLDELVWGMVGGRPRRNRWRTLSEVPAKTAESDGLSRALRQRGFAFVGSTICYAFMQAVGMVNDHLVGCFRHAQV